MVRAALLRTPAPVERAPLELSSTFDPGPLDPLDVAIEVHACGVCRTDVQLCEGELGTHLLPVVPGHQIIGRVVAAGRAVRGVGMGDVVGVSWIASACGACRFCAAGRENLCAGARFTGWDRHGGFAELVHADHRFVSRVPDGLDAVAAAPLLCGGVIGLRALRLSGVADGGRLGLFGFGASATVVIQLARARGCEVYVVTRSIAEQERARSMGAVWAGAYDQTPPVPLDAAVTFAPAGEVVVHALRCVDRGGTVAVNAIHLDRVPAFDYSLLWGERVLRSVANVTRADVAELWRAAVEIPLVTGYSTYTLDHVNGALRDARDGNVAGAAVIDLRR